MSKWNRLSKGLKSAAKGSARVIKTADRYGQEFFAPQQQKARAKSVSSKRPSVNRPARGTVVNVYYNAPRAAAPRKKKKQSRQPAGFGEFY